MKAKKATPPAGTTLVVTDPYMQMRVFTDWQLGRQGTVTIAELDRIAKLAVGETLDIKRDFGNGVLKITRTTNR